MEIKEIIENITNKQTFNKFTKEEYNKFVELFGELNNFQQKEYIKIIIESSEITELEKKNFKKLFKIDHIKHLLYDIVGISE